MVRRGQTIEVSIDPNLKQMERKYKEKESPFGRKLHAERIPVGCHTIIPTP